MLFQELCYVWLDYKKCLVKISTISTYRRTIVRQIIPILGSKSCEEISEQDILTFINELLESELSQKSVQDIVVIMKSIIRYGNIMKKTSIILDVIPCPKSVLNQIEILSRYEVKSIIQYLSIHPSQKNIGIYLSLYTGMRLGEICALKWDDIDMLNHKISISKTMQRIYVNEKTTQVIINPPKTRSSIRDIPIPYMLNTILLDIKERKGYVLTGTSRYIEPRVLQSYSHKVFSDLKIERKKFHIFRHTFATNCIQCGVDAKSLSQILGHTSVNITLNRYVHPSFDIKHQQIIKLSYE